MKDYYVYIMSSAPRVIYTGVTNSLERRVYQHKSGLVKGFSKKYNTHKLVYFEQTNDVLAAIAREKELKGWRREKKVALINQLNPTWVDLSLSW